MGSQLAERDWAATVRRAAQGDQAALAEFYDATSRYVFGLALRIVGDRSAAEEVVIDVYLQVWRQAALFDPGRGTPAAWLFAMTRSRALDLLRSGAQRAQSRRQSLDTVAELPDPGPGPEVEADAAGRSRLVRNALASLSPEQREAVELAYFGGLSQSEIADRTGVPLGTAKTRIRLGMIRLRQVLEPFAQAL